MKILILIFSITLINSIEDYNEIIYKIQVNHKLLYTSRLFLVKFNKINGIQVQFYEKRPIYKLKTNYILYLWDRGLKTYNLTNEELGIMPIKELFKNFNEIIFPNNTDFTNNNIDTPIWHLIVDGKDYYSNINTYFYDKINYLVNFENIEKFCKKKYFS